MLSKLMERCEVREGIVVPDSIDEVVSARPRGTLGRLLRLPAKADVLSPDGAEARIRVGSPWSFVSHTYGSVDSLTIPSMRLKVGWARHILTA